MPIAAPLLRFVGALAVLFTGTIFFSGLAFVTQVLLSRRLPVADVGTIAALLAVVNFLTPLATGGVNYFLLQAFGREGWGATRWIAPGTRLTAMAILLSCLVLAAYVTQWSPAAGVGRLFLVFGSILILLGQVFIELATARFQLEGRYSGLSAWQGLTQSGRFATVVAAIAFLPSLPAVLAGYAVTGAVSTLGGVLLLRGLWRGRLRIPGQARSTVLPSGNDRLSLGDTARQSLPFALMTMFYVFYFQGPIVALEWLNSRHAAGIYNAAFLLISAMAIVPTVVYMKFLLPKICRWAEHDRGAFQAAFHIGVPAMLTGGVGLMVLVFVAGPWAVPTLFGSQYAPAVPALMILALSIPVRFVQSVYSSLFISSENMVRKVHYLGLSAVAGGIASLLLVPGFGVEGAAMATLLAEACLLVLHINGTVRFIDGINVLETMRVKTLRASVNLLLHERHSEL